MKKLRLALAQINCTMGDIAGNCRKIREYLEKARGKKADLIAFPELTLTGYPPEDLLFKSSFLQKNREALSELEPHTKGINAVIGCLDGPSVHRVYNGAAFFSDGRRLGTCHKICLPNYGVFDEKRYFAEGQKAFLALVKGIRVGICICEDVWLPSGPICTLVREGGAELVMVINASPYHMGKWKERQEVIRKQSIEHGIFLAYCNLVGGQDELVYDGHSLVYDNRGHLLAQGKQFEEDLLVIDLLAEKNRRASNICRSCTHRSQARHEIDLASADFPPAESGAEPDQTLTNKAVRPVLPHLEEIYQALLLGIRDYTRKNNFSHVLIGLSGGIDSALTTVLAVDSLGPSNVRAVFMPSRYSAPISLEDSRLLAQRLDIPLWEIPIQEIFERYLQALAPRFRDLPADIAEENLQARIRGNILMALSNKFDWLVLTTGNKSEMSVGYATLYGDMAGGFAVLKDVFKTLVYQLAKYRNSLPGGEVIPRRVIEREPSAELAAGQKDSDSLPSYTVLDPILSAYVEEEKGINEVIDLGFPRETVKRVIDLVDRSEYKRRQAPVGIKITPKAFGRDRRLPITNLFQY